MPIRGVHVLALVVVLFGALAVMGTERYTARYQMLPVVDWLESRPPLVESGRVPPAADLARGLLRAIPLLSMRDDVQPLVPILGPPTNVQRNIAGVRDAASIELVLPDAASGDRNSVSARLGVIVFNRALRAAAWSELMARVLDVSDTATHQPQVRLAGDRNTDGVWLVAPRAGGGTATIAGYRGPVGFELQVECARFGATRPEELLDLSARAEAIARQAASEWTVWLEARLDAA